MLPCVVLLTVSVKLIWDYLTSNLILNIFSSFTFQFLERFFCICIIYLFCFWLLITNFCFFMLRIFGFRKIIQFCVSMSIYINSSHFKNARHGTHRSALFEMQCSYGSCIRWWSATEISTVLHQFCLNWLCATNANPTSANKVKQHSGRIELSNEVERLFYEYNTAAQKISLNNSSI